MSDDMELKEKECGEDAIFNLVGRMPLLRTVIGKHLAQGIHYSVYVSEYDTPFQLSFWEQPEIYTWGEGQTKVNIVVVTDGDEKHRIITSEDPRRIETGCGFKVPAEVIEELVISGGFENVISIGYRERYRYSEEIDSTHVRINVPRGSKDFDFLETEPFFLFPGDIQSAREVFGKGLKLARRKECLYGSGQTPGEAETAFKYQLMCEGAVGAVNYDDKFENRVSAENRTGVVVGKRNIKMWNDYEQQWYDGCEQWSSPVLTGVEIHNHPEYIVRGWPVLKRK